MSDNPPPSHAQYFEQLLAMGTPPPFLEVPPPPTAPGPFPVDASETSPYTPRPMFDSTHPYPMALHINPTSDRTSDACSQSESQTPGGSTTSRHQHSTENTRRKKPTTLSYYQSTEVHAPLAEAKESFAATSFASGCSTRHRIALVRPRNWRKFANSCVFVYSTRIDPVGFWFLNTICPRAFKPSVA